MMPFGFSAGPVQIATCNFPPRSCDLFTLPPHAPCRLQHGWTIKLTTTLLLCLHTPRADCNNVPECKRLSDKRLCLHTPRADCNLKEYTPLVTCGLCLHTPRADCNRTPGHRCEDPIPLPPHAPCRLQHNWTSASPRGYRLCLHTPRADCNPTRWAELFSASLCLHTPRADCNICVPRLADCSSALPPHAPCRLQRSFDRIGCASWRFASTRPVQIATECLVLRLDFVALCLHTPRADCNTFQNVSISVVGLCLHTPRADCNTI